MPRELAPYDDELADPEASYRAGSSMAPPPCYSCLRTSSVLKTRSGSASGWFQRRGGRKRIVAPDGSELGPATKPQPDGTLVKALVRAHRWQRMLGGGEYATLAALANAEGIRQSYVCRVLRLTLLAPDIVERILDGRPTAGLSQLLKPFPVEWKTQRQRFC